MLQPARFRTHRWVRGSVAAATAVVLTATATATPAGAEPNNNTSRKLREAVTAQGVASHLEALDAIGAANNGTRAAGTPGYAASVDYVVERLEAAGYRPSVQPFRFPYYREVTPATLRQVSPDAVEYTNGPDFVSMTYSAPGVVRGTVVAVDTDGTPSGTSTSGCEAADFKDFPAGAVALVQRGTCTFATKAQHAQDAGAVATIVFNRGTANNTAAVAGTLGAPTVSTPVLGASYALGLDLMRPEGTVVELRSDTISEQRTTWNVLAETAGGDPANVVMAGAHLDSVMAGPGVNDNGSGSATVLAVAEQMAKVHPVNKVRFAWWGAEELGLLGSEHYVGDLAANDPQGLARIGLYLNFDMVGSPNYVRFVYDGDNSRFPIGPGAAEGPKGSGAIEQMFHDYFASQGLASEETPFSGRSDYGPFVRKGIASGGLFTGAEGVKTAEQAAIFGGVAGLAYDRCYHQVCDNEANVNMQALDEMSDAVAHAILTYAMDSRSVNGRGKGHPVTPPGEQRHGTPTGSGTAGGGGLHDDHDHEEEVA